MTLPSELMTDDFGDASITAARAAEAEVFRLLAGHPVAVAYVESLGRRLEETHRKMLRAGAGKAEPSDAQIEAARIEGSN